MGLPWQGPGRLSKHGDSLWLGASPRPNEDGRELSRRPPSALRSLSNGLSVRAGEFSSFSGCSSEQVWRLPV